MDTRVHSLKFQCVALPNGITVNIFTPVGKSDVFKCLSNFSSEVFHVTFIEGKKHDAGMVAEFHLLEELEANAFSLDGNPICIYRDPTYLQRVHLQVPFQNANLTPMMKEFNTTMSSVGVTMEWLFRDVIVSFRFVDFRKNLKIGMSRIGKMYIVCALTCLYGNRMSNFFKVDPPSLDRYFTHQ